MRPQRSKSATQQLCLRSMATEQDHYSNAIAARDQPLNLAHVRSSRFPMSSGATVNARRHRLSEQLALGSHPDGWFYW